jgi:hypothetical protein
LGLFLLIKFQVEAYDMSGKAKDIIKRFIRYLRSVYWYIVLYKRNKNTELNEELKSGLAGNCDEVHIVCPGPSATMIESEKIEPDAPLVFINHAVGMADSEVFSENKRFFFSADPVRVDEVIESKNACLEKCVGVLVPGHLFHLKRRIAEKIKYIYLPECEFSSEYGLVAKTRDTKEFVAMPERAVGFGFGSLITSISFAMLFSPKVIHIWGSDFGKVAGKMYYSSDISNLAQIPFELIRKTLSEITAVLDRQNIKIVMHNHEES